MLMWHLGTWFTAGLTFGLEDLRENFQPDPRILTHLQCREGKAEQPKPGSDFHPFSRSSSTPGFQLHLSDFQSVRQVCWMSLPGVPATLRGQATALPCSRQEMEPCTKSPPRINDQGLSALFSSTSARLILRLHAKSADVYKQR